MKGKYGFVYIWRDRKRNMYYIGCHWGTEEDGYICSSNRMRDAYRRRPTDFKRRILETKIQDKKLLLEREYVWLQMIENVELGNRYYNLKNTFSYHWISDKDVKTICKKISKALTGKKMSDETRKKMSDAAKGREPWNKGIPATEEQKRKQSESMKGKPAWNKGKKCPEMMGDNNPAKRLKGRSWKVCELTGKRVWI